MNTVYSYLTTIYESILPQIYVFLVVFTFVYHDFQAKLQKYFLPCTFVRKTFIHRRRITVNQLLLFFLIHPACHSKVTKTESNRQVTKMDWQTRCFIAQKVYIGYWEVKLSVLDEQKMLYNTIARIFVRVLAFEIGEPF